MNETFSASQAKQIASMAENIMDGCIRQISQKSIDFGTDVSKVWEDKNAVAFFKTFKSTLAEVGEKINGRYSNFVGNLVAIANSYARVGGMAPVSIMSKHLQLNVDFAMVKETFVNSEYPDSFGFNDIYTAPSVIMSSFDTLISELKIMAQNAEDSIKAIPAFGNQDVRNAIGNAARLIVDLMVGRISHLKSNIQESISETSRAYLRAGIQAANAAAGIASNGTQEAPPANGESVSGSQSNPSTPGSGMAGEGGVGSQSNPSTPGSGVSEPRTPYTPTRYGEGDSNTTAQQRVSVEPISTNTQASGSNNAVYGGSAPASPVSQPSANPSGSVPPVN